MSIQVLQKPSDIQAAQSPIVFSVITSGSQAYTASEFQYTANLYVWSGNMNQSGSYIYQARKYPNQSGSGIFDFSRMINSTLTELSATNGSYIKYYKVDFGFQYESGSTYVTQSGALTPVTCSVGGTLFKAYDGYATFPEQINTNLSSSCTNWPWMTDMGTVTQSVFIGQFGDLSNAQLGTAYWKGANDETIPSSIVVSASYANGTRLAASISTAVSGSTTSSLQVAEVITTPGLLWDTFWPTIPTASLDTYTIQAFSGSVALGSKLNYEVVCVQYYTPITIAYKNRFGQFDYINFFKRHDTQFNTDQRVYQPQLGTWQSSTLSYNQYQTRQQRYIVDTTEVLSVNSDWLEEGYNDLMKQLLVSDEIYWVKGPYTDREGITPLTIQTNSLLFKTHVNNKLIQYTITFDIGQPYKLIL
jgi:hypothetical protein